MKRILVILLFLACVAARGQAIFFGVNFNTATAATPTFSPASPYSGGATTVTASTSTSPCAAYIYFDTSNPPITQQATYSYTTTVTLYAYVHGCPGYNDSSVAIWTGTYHAFTSVRAWTCSKGTGTGTTINCTASAGFTTGDAVIFIAPICITVNCLASAVSSGTLTIWPGTAYTGYGQVQNGIVTGITPGATSFTITIGSEYTAYTFPAEEVSGVNSASPVGAQVGMTQSYTHPSATGSVSPSGSGAWEVCGFVSNDANSMTITAGTGYGAFLTIGGTSPALMECSTSPLAAGTYNPGVTTSAVSLSTIGTVAFTLN